MSQTRYWSIPERRGGPVYGVNQPKDDVVITDGEGFAIIRSAGKWLFAGNTGKYKPMFLAMQ